MPKGRGKKTATMWGAGKTTGSEIESGQWGTLGDVFFLDRDIVSSTGTGALTSNVSCLFV